MTLGGRRVAVRASPGPERGWRVGGAVGDLSSISLIATRSGASCLERMLAGVSTRKYRRAQEPVGAERRPGERSTSKSAVSRTFVERTREALWQLMSRQLADLRLAVMMLDGIELKGRMNIVALGDHHRGRQARARAVGRHAPRTRPSRARCCPTSSTRGLDVEQGLLFAIDGSKALRKAIRQVFGDEVPVQRCVRHKERNVTRASPRARPRPRSSCGCANAWKETDHDARARAATPPRRRARARAPRRRRLAARRDGGDADRDPAGDHRQAQARPAVDQPVRVDGAPRGAM